MSSIPRCILDFEANTVFFYKKLENLKTFSETGQVDMSDAIRDLEKKVKEENKALYDHLTPEQIIQLARHPQRPTVMDYIEKITSDFFELHGDRQFGEDPSILCGMAHLDDHPIMLIGHHKGKSTQENLHFNFGMPQPEGFRKAHRCMKLAEKLRLPILTLVDTPGAFPGIEAEERGQAEAIAQNLSLMAGLTVPVITVVTGEGGSGGALALAVANTVFMLEYSIYSVISPEGCAAILWNDSRQSAKAAQQLKITARDLLSFGVIDQIIDEPYGGAHFNPDLMAATIKETLLQTLQFYHTLSPNDIQRHRYHRFRGIDKAYIHSSNL